MYNPPVLPATGGGLVGTAGLVAGYVLSNWLIIGVSILVIAITFFCFLRLRQGEKNFRNKN